MRFRAIIALLFAAAMLWGCSGSDAEGGDGSCEAPIDCSQGFTCMEGKCAQVECQTHTDCPGLEGDKFCAPAGVDPANPDKKLCSGIECKNDTECDPGQVCNEFLRCEAEGVGSDVIDDVVAGTDVPSDPDTVTKPTAGNLCTPCSTDADCDGLKCYPLGAGTFCFGECETNNDCGSGWICHPLTNDAKQCIPMAFNCDATCLIDGCPEGQVCNQETGACAAGAEDCGTCQQDWDCAAGLRCYSQDKLCAPPCGDGCPTNSSCQSVNALPVDLCISSTAPCCYGDDCANPCQAPTPYPQGGECVECIEDAHCGEGKYCEQVSHTCMSAACQPPTPFQKPDGTCVECLNTGHCAAKGATYGCNNNACVSDDKPAECDYCEAPYSACAEINGIWSCVQCTDDTYCPGSTCDLTLYACKNGGGNPGEGCGVCQSDADCVSAMGDKVLACDAASGCCYDTSGFCDDVESYCDGSQNSECLGLMELLMGGMGGIPGMPEGSAGGICTCTEPMGMEGFMCLLMPPCPAGGCLGDSVCIDPSAIPMLGDMLGAMAGNIDGLCLNPNSILDMLGGGIF